MDFLRETLEQRKAQGLYRRRRTVEGVQAPQMRVDGREVLSFCSNDYLGLAADPRIAQAMCDATQRYGVGAGAAHLINGHSQAHHALEQELAEFVGRDRALLFSTGYMANLAVISALLSRSDSIIQDKLNHASLLDGAQLSRAKLLRYAHADVSKAQVSLDNAKGRKLLATDGVFSMDGDIAPLPELAALCQAQEAMFMVDDAHGIGVLGEQGAGSLNAAGLEQEQAPILMATLGKGIGTAGAFVAGSEALIEYLIQVARPYIYTTAMPAAVAEATRASLKISQTEQWRRDKLAELIGYFRESAQAVGLQLMPSPTAIQPILLGEVERANRWSAALQQRDILVTAIRPPTVPNGTARLRVTFSAAHTLEQVDQLLAVLRDLQQAEAA